MESLRHDLPRMLEAVGQPLSSEMRTYIAEAAPLNAGRHACYTDFYDDELRNLVAERDAPVIARHGYRFGD